MLKIRPLNRLLLLVPLTSLCSTSASFVPSFLPNSKCDAIKASSSLVRPTSFKCASTHTSQSEPVPHRFNSEPQSVVQRSQTNVNPLDEPFYGAHGAKRKQLFDLNLCPEEDESKDETIISQGSRDPTTSSTEAESPIIPNLSKKARKKFIGSEDSLQFPPNLRSFSPASTELSPVTRDLATMGAALGKNRDSKKPYLDENNLEAVKENNSDMNYQMAVLPQDMSMIVSHSIKARARAIAKRPGIKIKNRSNPGNSDPSVGSDKCLGDTSRNREDQISVYKQPDVEAKAQKQLERIFRAPTHKKKTRLVELFAEFFIFDGAVTIAKAGPQKTLLPNGTVHRTPYENLQDELVLRKTVKRRIESLTNMTRRFLKKTHTGPRSRCVTEKMKLIPSKKNRLTHEVLLALGIEEFEKIEGHPRIVTFFSEAYQDITGPWSSTSSKKSTPLSRTPPHCDLHIALEEECAPATRNLAIHNSEGIPLKMEKISSLRDEVFQNTILKRNFLYAIDSTMIFFYFLRYTHRMMLAIKSPLEVEPEELQTGSINFLITYWSSFFGLNRQSEKQNDKTFPVAKVVTANLKAEMKTKKDSGCSTIEVNWARSLLSAYLSLDESSKWFFNTLMHSRKNEKFLFAFMRAQAFSELKLKARKKE